MISLKPTLDNFRVVLPRDFFYQEVIENFEPFIKLPFDNLYDYIEESIKTFEVPSFNFNPIEYRGNVYSESHNVNIQTDISQRAGESEIDLIDKKFTITFRFNSGYLNWVIMLFQYYRYYTHSQDKHYFGTFLLELYTPQGLLIAGIEFSNVIFTGVSGFELDYSNTTSATDSFTCSFTFNNFAIKTLSFND